MRIGLVTLGCDKNTVDSERILARLVGAGAGVSGEVDGADVVVVNTCGFIDVAREESVDALLAAVRLKALGKTRAVVAMGCLVQRHKAELEAELPEVDLFLGLTEADRLLPELWARGLLAEPATDVPIMERPLRVLTTSTPHTSFLKVSEGCDHACAFCAIPLMRGKHRSTPIERLVREAIELERSGVVELNLVSQDTTWYGRDWLRGAGGAPLAPPGSGWGSGWGSEGRPLGAPGSGSGWGSGSDGAGDFFIGKPFAGMAEIAPTSARRSGGGAGEGGVEPGGAVAAAETRRSAGGAGSAGHAAAAVGLGAGGNGHSRYGALPALLRALLGGTDIPWFRLFYMYPSGIRPELVELIAREERILPYLDMPIQHGADAVLARMRRPERQATIRERVGWLRDAVHGIVLRTTVIVGFPGETEDDFEALLELLEEIRFDRLGAFAYSTEEGTPAATMPDPVPEPLRRERLERLLDVQRAISLERNESRIGREVVALVDRIAGEDGRPGTLGRTTAQALDVDGVTRIRGAAGARPGEFIRVRITGADEDDLIGERVTG